MKEVAHRDLEVQEGSFIEQVTPFVIVSKEKRKEIVEQQKCNPSDKIKEARIKRQSSKSKDMLEFLLKFPAELVGKRIKHKVQETKDDIPDWFDAKVKQIETEKNDTIKTMYDIYYDEDGADILFTYPLLNELKKGNIMILK